MHMVAINTQDMFNAATFAAVYLLLKYQYPSNMHHSITSPFVNQYRKSEILTPQPHSHTSVVHYQNSSINQIDTPANPSILQLKT